MGDCSDQNVDQMKPSWGRDPNCCRQSASIDCIETRRSMANFGFVPITFRLAPGRRTPRKWYSISRSFPEFDGLVMIEFGS